MPLPIYGGSLITAARAVSCTFVTVINIATERNRQFWTYIYSFQQNQRTWQTDRHTDTAWRHRLRLHSIARQKLTLANCYRRASLRYLLTILIILFLVSHFDFLFIPSFSCGRLSWLPVSFLLHIKYTLSYRIVPAAKLLIRSKMLGGAYMAQTSSITMPIWWGIPGMVGNPYSPPYLGSYVERRL